LEGGSVVFFPATSESFFFASFFFGFVAYVRVRCADIRELTNGEMCDVWIFARAAMWREDFEILARLLDFRNIDVMLG
jgi:hypothetical protein